jgi:UDPglucose 6-dehydrogenase
MNILYIGSGFVGTCSAAIAASSGHDVLVYDIDEKKIKQLASEDRDVIQSCLHEEGLGDLLVTHKERITFTTEFTNVEMFLDTCDVVFLCLPTPEIDETGESNLSYYFDALQTLTDALIARNSGMQEQYIVLVNKSTVPIDMAHRTGELLQQAGVKHVGVVSNPEFLVEGKAIQGSIRPDRIVVGAEQEKDFEIMRRLYERFYHSPTIKYVEVNPKEAAAGKLLANYYLFQKLIACYDVIGRTSEAFDGIQFEKLRDILVTDKRIGNWGFFDSLYAGGSCLVKDVRSLTHQLRENGVDVSLLEETYNGNKRQLITFLARAEREAFVTWNGATVALLGTAFKRDTNDIRNSPSIDIVQQLIEKKVQHIQVYDPVAMTHFKTVFPPSDQCMYVDSAEAAIADADIVIIATDWPQFRQLTETLLVLPERPFLMDGRRMLQHRYKDLKKAGYDILAVGSPFIQGKK